MRLERLNYNKIKIFLTFDDLVERGLTKEDLWYNAPKVQQLFRDMMEEANKELGFELDGVLAVEVFSLQAQGMIVIITKESASRDRDNQGEYFEDEFIEMQVTLDESDDIVYSFQSFEDVIALAARLSSLNVEEGQLIYFENKYFLFMNVAAKTFDNVDQLIAILAEFGDSSMVSIHRLLEYGNVIMKQNAMKQVYKYFVKQ